MVFWNLMIMVCYKMRAEIAKSLAESEYEKYRVEQDRLHESDFDKLVEATKIDQNKEK